MSFNTFKWVFVCIGLGCATVSSAMSHASEFATPLPPRDASFETRLHAAVREIRAQNLSAIVGLSHDGAPTELFEFGALARDNIAPEVTQIDINSITKTVTATMVAKLVEQDVCDLTKSWATSFQRFRRTRQT